MKSLKLTILAIATVLLFMASCERIEPNVFGIKNFTHSDCKNSGKKSLETETIRLKTVNSNDLEITHSNVYFNCCPGEIKTETSLNNDTIILSEYATADSCDCICTYDLKYTIGKIDYGKYRIKMTHKNDPYFSFIINFNEKTDTTIVIKHNIE